MIDMQEQGGAPLWICPACIASGVRDMGGRGDRKTVSRQYEGKGGRRGCEVDEAGRYSLCLFSPLQCKDKGHGLRAQTRVLPTLSACSLPCRAKASARLSRVHIATSRSLPLPSLDAE